MTDHRHYGHGRAYDTNFGIELSSCLDDDAAELLLDTWLTSRLDALKRTQLDRAVQRCRLAVTESALQHPKVEVCRLIARGIPEPANV